jgi:hypothetical protein
MATARIAPSQLHLSRTFRSLASKSDDYSTSFATTLWRLLNANRSPSITGQSPDDRTSISSLPISPFTGRELRGQPIFLYSVSFRVHGSPWQPRRVSNGRPGCFALVTDTHSANRALHVSVTHGHHNLCRLPKDELDRQREGSMRELLFSVPSFHKADQGAFLRSLQIWFSERKA